MVAVLNGALARARLSVALTLLLLSLAGPSFAAGQTYIFGSPPTSAMVDQLYRFRAMATATDSGPIWFGAVNVPSWATFDPQSGTLEGVPGAADMGRYDGIRIYAQQSSDGIALLPAFAITVSNVYAGGAVSLQWTPPTENEDDSVLTDLAGYRIYGGASPAELQMVASFADAGLTRYFIDSLPPGRHFFAVTAIAANGAESEMSSIVDVLIP